MVRKAAPDNQRRNGKKRKKSKNLSEIRTESPRSKARRNLAAGKTSGAEVVGLSLTPVLRQRLENSLASVPDVDSMQVEEIRAAIEDGTYHINAEKIADAIIRFEQSLSD